MKAALVYQAGIANVFAIDAFSLRSPDRRNARRVYQGDFRGARAVCIGLAIAGWKVRSAHCNQAGDVVNAKWSADLDDAPFSPPRFRAN